MIKKVPVLLNIFFLFFLLLSSCKKNNIDIVSPDNVDEIKVTVTNTMGDVKMFTVTDKKEIERLSIKIHMVFGETKKTSWFVAKELTENEKNFKYQLKFYKSTKMIQEIIISQNNKLSVDSEKIIVDRERELNNLKKHLLAITT
ncbi:hypothetical protein [Enterococcus columbae]|uniref:Lipoprotein n=1 Tax=Enterococcus columbae DSM 7374 = ATCC 51263 TaxID=1121865 RepID=S0K4B5_9ENTE|nr:hypothetical protein [Enterococcus columbae]EOT39894.1 hypothetical protein OMW_01683 [Enterococcus columbae DSM 7374 = ATCC 51263]EOW83879.1 hypothetical protein I568_01326 [Enterococcus columbae DSM 7374 = ATCC 51263]